MQYQRDKLAETIIASIIKVHQILGPGFKESIYRNSLLIELRKNDLATQTEKEIVIFYEGQEVGRHRLDIVVQNKIIIELKTVEDLSKAHYAQVRSYLKATRLSVGILVNFAAEKADFRRIENT
ncbi:GxxExxY protein [bacterium]|nr:GxxExxY protein [bacterium]